MFLRLVPLILICVSSCTSDGNGSEQLLDLTVPGHETPSRVLYSRGDSETCRATSKRGVEIADRLPESESFRDGYLQVRVSTPIRYRAFFRPERVSAATNESAFILCANDSTPIGVNCSVIGTLPNGCFETGYVWYKLSEIESLIEVIRGNAPRWRQKGGT